MKAARKKTDDSSSARPTTPVTCGQRSAVTAEYRDFVSLRGNHHPALPTHHPGHLWAEGRSHRGVQGLCLTQREPPPCPSNPPPRSPVGRGAESPRSTGNLSHSEGTTTLPFQPTTPVTCGERSAVTAEYRDFVSLRGSPHAALPSRSLPGKHTRLPLTGHNGGTGSEYTTTPHRPGRLTGCSRDVAVGHAPASQSAGSTAVTWYAARMHNASEY